MLPVSGRSAAGHPLSGPSGSEYGDRHPDGRGRAGRARYCRDAGRLPPRDGRTREYTRQASSRCQSRRQCPACRRGRRGGQATPGHRACAAATGSRGAGIHWIGRGQLLRAAPRRHRVDGRRSHPRRRARPAAGRGLRRQYGDADEPNETRRRHGDRSRRVEGRPRRCAAAARRGGQKFRRHPHLRRRQQRIRGPHGGEHRGAWHAPLLGDRRQARPADDVRTNWSMPSSLDCPEIPSPCLFVS